MKHVIFWFAAAVLVVWVLHRSERREHQFGPPPLLRPVSRAKVVVHKIVSPGTGTVPATPGPGQVVYVIESDNKKIVTIDDAGVHVTPPLGGFEREAVEGIPVPVVPGTRTTEARIETPAPPLPPTPPRAKKAPKRRPQPPTPPRPPVVDEYVEPKVIAGRLSATEDRARADARLQLVNMFPGWLDPNVPRDWHVPNRLVDGMIREVTIVPVERDYGTLYQATMLVDASPRTRRQIVEAYRHEQVVKRLVVLGGGLAFALIALSALSGYIRADEATKGYYTNRLRFVSAVGVGAAGVAIYRMLT
jgi:hypothetical protein